MPVPDGSGVWPCSCDAGLDLDAPLAERAGHDPHHVLVAAGQDGRQGLEHRDLGAEIGRTSRRTRSRWRRRRSRPPTPGSVARGPSTSSEVSTSVPSTSKPGMVRGTEPAARTTSVPVISVVGAVVAGDAHPVVGQQGAGCPLKIVIPRPFMQPGQPLEQLVDDLLLAILADREVDRRLR